MKRKVFCFLLAMFAIAIFSLGCGGGGGSHSNPASPAVSGTARVSGVIVDSSKKPAENVDVRLALVSKPGLNALPENFRAVLRLATADTQTEFNTTTDKNGVYSFENVPYGRYSLSADAGTQGAYVANLVVAAEDITVQEQTLTPFGFVSGTVITNNGKNDIQVYGAMVNAGEKAAFTNNEGKFTLSHIPVGVKYELVTTLQGYGATETTTFTIPATGTLTLELENPIEIKPIQSENYSVKASVTGIGNVELPIYVIAQHSSIKDKIYFNTIKENPDKKTTLECSVNIVDAGDYNIFALSADRKETKAISFSTSASDKSVTLDFESETDNEIKVNIVNVRIDDEIGQATIDTNPTYDSYFDGYISCYSPGTGWFYKDLTVENSNWTSVTNSEIFYDSDHENNPVLYGNSVAYFSELGGTPENNGYRIVWQIADGSSNAMELMTETKQFDNNDRYVMPYLNGIALIPGEFMCVAYNYLDVDLNYCKVGLKAYTFNSSTSSQSGGTQAVEPVLYKALVDDVNDESKLVYDLRMAKGKDGNSYLAVLCSGEGLKIYNISTINSGGVVVDGALPSYIVVSDSNFAPEKLHDFQVLSSTDNTMLFYVEGGDNAGSTTTDAYLFESGAVNKYTRPSTGSSQTVKSCYIDKNGDMYRYDSSSYSETANPSGHKIIKISSSSNSLPQLDGTATSSLNLAEEGSNGEINGILGFKEDDINNTLTIYVY